MRSEAVAMVGPWWRGDADGHTSPSTQSIEPLADESVLLRRCRQGDEDAFRELLRLHRGRAVYVAAQILRDHAEAEDVAQEAFVRVFRSLPQFRGDSGFGSWLYRIVVNLCMDRRRRASTSLTVSFEEEWDPPTAPWSETRLQVDSLLARLSHDMRATLLLREVAGLSYEEIAVELSIPVGTVRSRLSAAREQFRRLWNEMEAEVEGAG